MPKSFEEACINNKVKEVRNHLLSLPADIRNGKSMTGLMLASSHGSLDVCKVLLEKKKSQLNERDLFGKTALLYSAENGHTNVLQLLLEQGASEDQVKAALKIAVESNQIEVVKFLLDVWLTIESKEKLKTTKVYKVEEREKTHLKPASIYNQGTKKKFTLTVDEVFELMNTAAKNKNVEIIQILLDTLSRFDNRNYDNTLYSAARKGYFHLVSCLLENETDLLANTRTRKLTDYDSKPINDHWDIETGKEQKENFATPLHIAAFNGHFEIVKYLVSNRADNKENEEDSNATPLHLASQKAHIEVVKFLVSKGAEIDIQSKAKNDWTPLHYAAWKGHFEIVKFLIEEQTAIEEKNRHCLTPLCKTSHKENLELKKEGENIELLPMKASNPEENIEMISLDCPVTIEASKALKHFEEENQTSLQSDNLDLVECLLEDREELELKEKDYWTPLHLAAASGHLETVRFLLGKAEKSQGTSNKSYLETVEMLMKISDQQPEEDEGEMIPLITSAHVCDIDEDGSEEHLKLGPNTMWSEQFEQEVPAEKAKMRCKYFYHFTFESFIQIFLIT